MKDLAIIIPVSAVIGPVVTLLVCVVAAWAITRPRGFWFR